MKYFLFKYDLGKGSFGKWERSPLNKIQKGNKRYPKCSLLKGLQKPLDVFPGISGFPGLHHINKKILRFLTKFSDFRKFPQIFKLCLYQNNLRKISRNLSSQLHQNILSGNLSDFLKKLVGSKNSDFCQKMS